MNSQFTTEDFAEARRLNIEEYNTTHIKTKEEVESEMEEYFHDQLVEKATIVWIHEQDIDFEEKLYLFTWAPDPAELPNTSFDMQHDYMCDLVANFLSCCSCGLACVEATQLGNPHYHGWYQLTDDPVKEKCRLAIIKTMQRFAPRGTKITESKGHIKINNYKQHANCLYYYKKDLLNTQLLTHNNPITSETKQIEDWTSMVNSHYFVVDTKRQSIADLQDKINLKEFYDQFYSVLPGKHDDSED